MDDRAPENPASQLEPANSPAAITHLNMLQAVITRLAGNSAQCKTWCVAIVSALFGLAGATISRSPKPCLASGTSITPSAGFGTPATIAQ